MNTNPTGGRLAAIITGGVLASIALLVLVTGAGFAWLDNRKDADGYYMTDSQRFSTDTYALATENLDIDDDIPGSVSGNLRLDVQAGGGKPVFVGIARSRDVRRYLATSPHATLTDVEVDPFAADYRTSGGTTRPGAPAAQDIWVATRNSLRDPWSAPVNLGASVNTTAAETRPSLAGGPRRCCSDAHQARRG